MCLIMIRTCFFLFNRDQAMQSYMKFKLRTSPFRWYLFTELAIRIIMGIVYLYLEDVDPFHQTIAKEQLWKYQNPHMSADKVNISMLLVICFLIPMLFMGAYYVFSSDSMDLVQGFLGLTLSCLLNGLIIDVIKISVGRPRPDYYYRCFPDGKITMDLECTGDHDAIIEGRKSFPSGHTGWTFAGFFYLSLYLAGKVQCFCYGGKTYSWRLLAVIAPVLAGVVVGISRIQDNRHHWEDVVVGASIGIICAILSYHHYYPSMFSEDCFLSYPIPSSNDFSSSQSAINLNSNNVASTGGPSTLPSTSNSRNRLSMSGGSKLQLLEVTTQ